MDAFINISRRKTKVTISATYALVRHSLQLLLDGFRELSVLDTAGTNAELIEKITRRSPDVVLFCLTEGEGKNIEVLKDLRRVAPHVKAVILANPNNAFDHTAALKLGVTGIVGTNQNPRVLVRAISQVSEGEVWLNQKLIARLLDDDFAAKNGKTKKDGFFKDDLTRREIEVIGTIGLGLKNKEISKKLYISEATVRHHLSSIYSKLNIKDRLNLAIYAHQQQMVEQVSAMV